MQRCAEERERIRVADSTIGGGRGKGRKVEEEEDKDGRWRSERRGGKGVQNLFRMAKREER